MCRRIWYVCVRVAGVPNKVACLIRHFTLTGLARLNIPCTLGAFTVSAPTPVPPCKFKGFLRLEAHLAHSHTHIITNGFVALVAGRVSRRHRYCAHLCELIQSSVLSSSRSNGRKTWRPPFSQLSRGSLFPLRLPHIAAHRRGRNMAGAASNGLMRWYCQYHGG